MRRVALAALALAPLACATALREPAPLPPPASTARSADAVLADAAAAWGRRADPAQARAAEELYAEAAALDERRVEGLLGAMAALTFRIERERDPAVRDGLAARAVGLGQWCRRRAPGDPACDYRLAIALGQQARERTATAHDALGRMLELLRGAAARAPRLDAGGPQRVLALVLLRAPGWPLGPGDPEAGLEAAREAAALFPDAPPNQLVLAEALDRNGRAAEARAAWERAAALAERVDASREPEALRWRAEAAEALARGSAAER